MSEPLIKTEDARPVAVPRANAPVLEVSGLKKHFPIKKGLLSRTVGQVYAVDGHQFFNRPGPRLVESLEILAEIFHPERFNFGHRKNAWVRLRAD